VRGVCGSATAIRLPTTIIRIQRFLVIATVGITAPTCVRRMSPRANAGVEDGVATLIPVTGKNDEAVEKDS